jgi:glycosyltransferase 2 family protein
VIVAVLSTENSTTRSQTYRRWLVFGLSIALTVATLYFVFRGIDRGVLARLLSEQDRTLLVAAAAFVLLQISFGAERWRAILAALMRGRPPPLLRVQAVFYASIFFNYLPLGTIVGDVARVLLARRFPLSVRQLVVSVLLDRILVVSALLVLAVISLPSIAHPLAASIWFGSVAVLVCAAAGFLLLQPIERLLGPWRDQRLINFVLHTTEDLRHLVGRGGLLGLVWAAASAACGVLAAYCIARSLGIDVGLVAMTAVMSIVTFVAALPISLAGWGVREVSLVALLGLLGVDREAALLLSVEVGLISTLLSLPGGVVWLTLKEQGGVVAPSK